MPPRDPGNLIQGVGYVYWAPIGTTEPDDNKMHIAPVSPWVDLGFTEGGISLSTEGEWENLTVDQIIDIVERRQTQRALQFQTSFAEATLETFNRVMNQHGTITAVAAGAAGSGTAAGSRFEPGASELYRPTYAMFIVDGFAPAGFARRIIIRRGLMTENVEFAYQKDDKTVLGCTIGSHYVSTSVRPFKIVDQTAAPV